MVAGSSNAHSFLGIAAETSMLYNCCCYCCDKADSDNFSDELFDLGPTEAELEYIDDFVEPPPSRVGAEPTPSPVPAEPSTIPSIVKSERPQEMAPPPPAVSEGRQLGYWNIRGAAEQIRIFCHYLGEEYEEKLFEYGPGPEYLTLGWEDTGLSEALVQLELPFWIDGDVRIVGTLPILEYLAEKHKLLPSNSDVRSRMRKLQEQIDGLRMKFAELCHDSNWSARKFEFLRLLPRELHNLSTTLGNRNWICGRQLNYPDFNLYELLDMLVQFEPKCLKHFKNLRNFMLRFKGLSNVKTYVESEDFRRRSFFSPKAAWDGGQREAPTLPLSDV